MNQAPNCIEVACPKCRKHVTIDFSVLGRESFTCLNCRYCVIAIPEVNEAVKEAHEAYWRYISSKV